MTNKLFAAVAFALLAAVTTTFAQNNTFKLAATLTSSSGVSSYTAQVAAIDVNGNGKIDLISANTALTNNGKAIFTSGLQYQSPAFNLRYSGWVAADVLGNGRVDVVTLTNLPVSPYTEGIVVYTNSGPGNNGVFSLGFHSSTVNVGNATATDIGGAYQGNGSLYNAGDVYGNDRTNLFYYNSLSNSLTLFTNNGSGVFGSNTTFGVKMNLPVVADVNRDGKVDFIAPWFSNSVVYVFTNNGSGMFGSNAVLNVTNPVAVVAADVNGDGWVDLIVESVINSANPITTLSIWTNNGSGVFGSNVSFTVGAVGERVMDLHATNIFGDGQLDLVMAVADFAHSEAGYLMVYTNNGSGSFGSNATVSVGAGTYPVSLAAADVNGDGALDFVCANNETGTLTVFTNTGSGIQSGSFLSNSTSLLLSNSWVLSAADLYRNGKLELITSGSSNSLSSGYSFPELLVLTNNGSGVFGSNSVVGGFSPAFNGYPYQVASAPIMADIFGNGMPAMLFLVTNYNSGLVMVLTNNGSGVFGTNSALSNFYYAYSETAMPVSLAVADVNSDGKPDLIVSAYANGDYYLEVFTNNGAGGFATNVVLDLESVSGGYQLNGVQLAIADVNHDGRQDLITALDYDNYSWLLVFTNLSASGAGPLYSSAYGYFSRYEITAGAIPSALVAADVNGDGNVDFIIANNNNPGTLSVMTNSGAGNYYNNYYYAFGLYSSPVVGAYPHALVAADVNHDGKVDLISANWGLSTNAGDARGPLNWGTLSVLTNNGTGGFTNPATFSVGRGPTALLAADVLGNGQLDLITANSTAFTNQNTLEGTNWFGRGGKTLSVLFNTSNFVNTVVLQTAPGYSYSPITYGQALSAAGLTGGVATNEAGVTVAGSFAFNSNSVPGAGTANYPVTFAATPPTDYQPVTFNVSVTVNPLTAILKGARAYDGTTNAVYSVLSVSNRVGSDNVTVAAGSVGLAAATPGTNSITSTNGLALGGSAAANYTLAGVSGSIIITQALNAILLASSQNPSAYGASVNFTATLPAYATGTIQFLTNGVAFDLEGLTSGSTASVATTLLPLGMSAITAAYSGDSNDKPVTNNLSQLVNAPQFNPITFGAGGLVLSGSWGVSNGTYYILASTDLSLPTSQWTPVYTNQFDGNGNFSYTNTAATNSPQEYYQLQSQ